MVGRHAGAHEPERGGQPVDHVHLDGEVLGVQQMPSGIEAGGSGADDRDSQGVLGCSDWLADPAELIQAT
jgi:hypothetical protein